MWGVNETRFLVQHESCSFEGNCGLNDNVCNSKEKWNHSGCRYECKELDYWSYCKDDYVWNPSTSDSECNKTYKIDGCLDIKKCFCKKRLFGKLVLACQDEILNTTENATLW